MNRTNENIFNRPPRRTSYDINIDSANRDKVKFPEANNYVIKVPNMGGPAYRNVRSVSVINMRVPQSEGLTPHMHAPAFVRSSEAHSHATHKHSHAQDEGCDAFYFREGFYIGAHNDLFRFTFHGQVFSIKLPHTLTPISHFKVQKHPETGETILVVKSACVSRIVKHCSVDIISTSCQVDGTYTVLECVDPFTLFLQPEHLLKLGEEGCSGFLYLTPPANAHELARYVTALVEVCTHLEDFDIIYETHDGHFLLKKPDGSTERRRCLLGDGGDIFHCKVPSGAHDLEHLGGALQKMLNPILIDENCDSLVFSLRFQPELTITLAHGHYLPHLLILAIAEQMTAVCGNSQEFRGKYTAKTGKFTLESHAPFSLHFQKSPGIAFVLGFQCVFLSDRCCYENKEPIFYRHCETGHNSTNLYSISLDPLRSQFTIHRSGSIECKISSITPVEKGTLALVECDGPHSFCANDVVIVQCDFIQLGLYVIKEVVCWNQFVLVCKPKCSQQTLCDGNVTATPRPFTLPLSLPECNIATLLGFERTDHIDPDSCYISDSKCLPTGELYLLLDCPEILAASEAGQPRVIHQFARDEPARYFVGRLDRYLNGTTFDFTQTGPAQADLFTGNTVTIDEITIRLFKSDGKLYDTNKCDHSFVLRIITEDS